MIAFISGHLDLTPEEFNDMYKLAIDTGIRLGHSFVVGDARGADLMAQSYLFNKTDKVVVYHMHENPRHNVGFETVGGFISDKDRDYAMTENSIYDIAWVRRGRLKSGTMENIRRRGFIRMQNKN